MWWQNELKTFSMILRVERHFKMKHYLFKVWKYRVDANMFSLNGSCHKRKCKTPEQPFTFFTMKSELTHRRDALRTNEKNDKL